MNSAYDVALDALARGRMVICTPGHDRHGNPVVCTSSYPAAAQDPDFMLHPDGNVRASYLIGIAAQGTPRDRMLVTKLAFVDLETSGLDPWTHEIIEAAVIIDVDGEVVDEFECSLPFDESRANPKALEINGWGKRPFPEQLDPVEAIAWIDDLTDGAFFVGNCPWFDDAFLKVLFRETPGWHYHLVDVENLIAGKFGLTPPWDSKRVSEAVGIPVPDGQHGAMVDARWSRDLYHAVLR